MILSCLIVLVRYDGVTVLAGLVQLLDQCMREGQESRASFGDFCFHGASACAAQCDHSPVTSTMTKWFYSTRLEKKQKKTLGIFASIEHQRVQPNVITFSSLISACEKDKNSEKDLGILSNMEHQRVQV